jgi:hypothetical protein
MSILSLQFISTIGEDGEDLFPYPELRLRIPSLEVVGVDDYEELPPLEELDLIVATRSQGKGFELFVSDALIEEFAIPLGIQSDLTLLNYMGDENPDEYYYDRTVWNVQKVTSLSRPRVKGRAQELGIFAYGLVTRRVSTRCPANCRPCPTARGACRRCQRLCSACADNPC